MPTSPLHKAGMGGEIPDWTKRACRARHTRAFAPPRRVTNVVELGSRDDTGFFLTNSQCTTYPRRPGGSGAWNFLVGWNFLMVDKSISPRLVPSLVHFYCVLDICFCGPPRSSRCGRRKDPRARVPVRSSSGASHSIFGGASMLIHVSISSRTQHRGIQAKVVAVWGSSLCSPAMQVQMERAAAFLVLGSLQMLFGYLSIVAWLSFQLW